MTDRDEPLSSEEMIRQARERIEDFEEFEQPEDLTEEPIVVEEAPFEEIAYQQPPAQPPPAPPSYDLFPEAGQPPPPRQARFRRGGLITAIAVAIFVGVGFFQTDGPSRDSSGVITEAGTLNVFEAEVGDCGLDPDPDGDFIESLDAVPCSSPHDIEVVAWAEYPAEPGEAYPGNDTLVTWGFDQCYPEFESYAGAPWESVLEADILVISPDIEAWDGDERSVMCAAIPPVPGTTVTGSISDVGPSAETIELGTVSIFDMQNGDCFDYGENVSPELIPLRGCEGLHDFEVIDLLLYPAGDDAAFPGEDLVLDWAASECATVYEALVGEPWAETSTLGFFYFTPTVDTWLEGDREVVCLGATTTGKRMIGAFGG